MSEPVSDIAPDTAVLEQCVHAATLAPSIYNSQPWRFRLRDGRIDVFADPVRALPAADPDGREMHISLGAAVLNSQVMLVANGLSPTVTLLPDPADRRWVARIEAGGVVTPRLHDVAMVAALARRRTVRKPYQDNALHPRLVGSLVQAAWVEEATLEVLDGTDAQGVLGLVRSGDRQLRAEPGYRAELARWTADVPDRQDGVPPRSFGSPSVNGALPMRDFGAYQPWLDRPAQPYEAHPTIAVLSTSGDTPEHWLRAGMGLERALLEATIAGVSASFFTQPLEIAHLRRLYDERRPHTATQMIFRLGYARQPGAVDSPRRPVADVLVED